MLMILLLKKWLPEKELRQNQAESSIYRNRSVEENLQLFTEMREGKYKEEKKYFVQKSIWLHPICICATRSFTGSNMPIIIAPAMHWCIYPMYDFAHGQSDSIENITHSICTLEFEVHRPLYNWFIEKLGIFPSHQYEFARLNLNYTVMSKRKLLQLVNEEYVDGWDDPRMPTYPACAEGIYSRPIRNFCERIGVQRRENIIDIGLLEFCVREDLNKTATAQDGSAGSVKLVIANYPEG